MVHSVPQTNIQLFNELRRQGYSKPDLELVRDSYELAMVLFTGRFQPSGKIFTAHVVGTAGILALHRLPAPVVAAGLLHSAYVQGDFGSVSGSRSRPNRRQITRRLGGDVEELVAKFPALHWESATARAALSDPERLSLSDRRVLMLRLADYMEHLLDRDLLYYGETGRRYYLSVGNIAVQIAKKLGLSELSTEINDALRLIEFAELPVDVPLDRRHNASFVVAPRSCRKRVYATAREKMHSSGAMIRRRSTRFLKRVYQRSCNYIQRLRRRAKFLEAKHDAFEALFPQGAVLERVATGFQFTEGPVWIEEEESLLFSDIPGNRILRLQADGGISVFREPSGYSNGLTRDRQRRLIACEHRNRRVARTESDGSIVPVAERFDGGKLNSPNDVVVRSDGAVYFTDPSYGIQLREREQPVEGVYRLSPDGKELSLVAQYFERPNGLAFSPDETKLYINDSQRRLIWVFDVRGDGSLTGGSIFYDMNVSLPGSPDGMKVDVEGRLYCAGPGGVWVFSNTGEHLGTIATAEKPSNCAWGGGDWRTLYITAETSVYRIRVNTRGVKI
jgi:gluconolactonase